MVTEGDKPSGPARQGIHRSQPDVGHTPTHVKVRVAVSVQQAPRQVREGSDVPAMRSARAQPVHHTHCRLSSLSHSHEGVPMPNDWSELLSESRDLISLTDLKVTLSLTVGSTWERLDYVLRVQR